MKKLATLLIFAVVASLHAQTTPPFGIRIKTPQFKAFINARIIVSPDKTIEKGTLVIKDGHIVSVGAGLAAPSGATVVDLAGKTIYPGFIDPCTQYGMKLPERPREPRRGRPPQYEGTRIGADAWNDAIHAEKNWVDLFQPDKDQSEALLKQGITAVQSCNMDGIFRGRSFVALLGEGLPNDLLLKPHSWHFASFNKGHSQQEYPSSLMGSIALIRQTLLDVDWYKKAHAAFDANPNQKMPEFNEAIEALAARGTEPMVFETDDELSLLRAHKISTEFGLPMVQIGSGFEYARLREIVACHQSIILPVDFPKVPEVKSTEDELDVSLAALRHWDYAPSNPRILDSAKVQFAFTTYRLKDNSQFLTNVRKAIRRGLSPTTALAALTSIPAQLCGIASETGTLETGKLADFLITNGDIFSDTTKILSVFIKGDQHELIPLDQVDFRGEYSLTLSNKTLNLSLTGDLDKIQGELKAESKKAKLNNPAVTDNELTFSVSLDSLGLSGIYRFTGRRNADLVAGVVSLPNDSRLDWTAKLTAPDSPKADTSKSKELAGDTVIARLTWPNTSYGFSKLPKPENVLVKNATIWTGEKDGTLENADLLVVNGKFAQIGKNLTAPSGARTIDATGKDLTAGVIDEHSHICIFGDVNEGTFAVTPEVRIPDVIDPDDINLYRAMAAGVTSLELLHGSANPIGGQCAIVKSRWGSDAEEMKFAGAPPTIKFALGENVKQSNWGEQFSIRYPQSRLGVETIMKDAFQAAREYEAAWKTYNALSSSEKLKTVPPRRDLTLDAVDDVINSRLFVHVHSYVQTEILMLMRLAEQFGFRIQTFTHILEGYKVADEMKAHGTTASGFADWWAYKYEVWDAIPENLGLMHDRGLVVSVNSDSPEEGRRLNQEAAKSIMYNNLAPEEVVKMFTLNPAIALKIDDKVGSIKVGKDADFVIWNTNPLSIYAKAEQTWIDGKRYFDIQTDSLAREADRAEKAALIQKALKAPRDQSGGRPHDGYKEPPHEYHCEDVGDYWKELNAYHDAQQ